MPVSAAVSRASFGLVHGRHLVYNTCWEDPRLDREALRLGAGDSVVVITSAGCNVLDYALDGPAHIHAVDMNPRQNALLELKMAGIRGLAYDDFFALFGRGAHARWRKLYADALRPHLSPWSAAFWDQHGHVFSGRTRRGSFYYHGTTGLVAWALRLYLRHVKGAKDDVQALLGAASLDEQRALYEDRVRPRVFGPALQWLLGRDAVLALLAVPAPQRRHLERDYRHGIADFIRERLDEVFTLLPLSDNYFWRVYLQGHYDRDSCPEYLKPASFAALKDGLVERITTHTMTVEQCLRRLETPATALVLLDHMDWLCDSRLPILRAEWQAIVDHTTPDARLIWRSGGRHTDFVDALSVEREGRTKRLGEMLQYSRELTDALHTRDRVRTYGSFHLARFAC